MSSNAFRGIVVRRESGETTTATEKEAEHALEAIVSDKVNEEEEEEEEEDVELVMGSLLCDITVPSYIEVTEQTVTETQKKAESAPSAEQKKPRAQPEPPKKETIASDAAEESKLGSCLTAGKPFADTVPPAGSNTDIGADFSYAIAPPSATPKPLTKEQKEAEEQKKFLQEVATGSAFKTPGDAKKGCVVDGRLDNAQATVSGRNVCMCVVACTALFVSLFGCCCCCCWGGVGVGRGVAANSKHWFTTSFKPLLYLVTP